MKPTVSFIILAWNADDYLENCLRSVFFLSAVNPLVFAVNNGSVDQTAQILQSFADKYPSHMDITTFPENRGTTVSRNAAIQKAVHKADWICVLDPDTIVNESAILRLLAALEQNKKALMAVPRMWDANNIEQLSCKKFPSIRGKIYKAIPIKYIQAKGFEKESYSFFPDENKEGTPPVSDDTNIYPVDYGISACWFMRSRTIEKIGYLDEKYFYAPEDVDYCVRIWKAGYSIVFVSGAAIYHLTQRLSHKKIFSKINGKHIQGLLRYFYIHRRFLRENRRKAKG